MVEVNLAAGQTRGLALAAFGITLVAYNNAVALVAGSDGVLRHVGEFGPFAVVVAVILWARAERLALGTLGFRYADWKRSVGWGGLAGLAMAAPALGFFAFPVIMREPVEYAGYQNADLVALAALLLIRLPLRTVLVEESLFRGLLQTRGIQLAGKPRGIAFSCTLFVLWHGVITYQTIGLTNLNASPLPVPLLLTLAAVPLAAAGFILSWLRLKTDGLTAPLTAHWVVNSCIALFLSAPSLPLR